MEEPIVLNPAQEFVSELDLPEITLPHFAPTDIAYEQGKKQAFVVGSQVNGFLPSVSSAVRADINNVILLAQLAANKKVPDERNIYDWYREYYKTLFNLGWTATKLEFSQYDTSNYNAEVHEAIAEIAGLFLGAAPAAMTVVTEVIKALAKMDEKTPWITLFNRESEKFLNALFQIVLIEQKDTGGHAISQLAFGIEAEKTITQVLFFKFKSESAVLRKHAGEAFINELVLNNNREKVAERVLAYTSEYLKEIPI